MSYCKLCELCVRISLVKTSSILCLGRCLEHLAIHLSGGSQSLLPSCPRLFLHQLAHGSSGFGRLGSGGCDERFHKRCGIKESFMYVSHVYDMN